MKTHKINITFEVTKAISAEQLTELLCKLIYENNEQAGETLETEVANIAARP